MTFIIAEIGSNWTNLEDCLNSVALAKNCGADAVKFQMFSQEELYGPGFYENNRYDIRNWIADLATKAEACEIEFMCSAFSPEGLDFVNPYVKRHKIASAELSHATLLARARAKDKPVILSTGASSIVDIENALCYLGQTPTTLMYCVSAYPAKNINLEGIDKLRTHFAKDASEPYTLKWNIQGIGYSCHSAEFSTPLTAVLHHRADVIEKHFKLRDMDSPDNGHSIGPKEFKKMVKAIRENRREEVNFPDTQEREMLLKHNRRLIITADITKGQRLDYGTNYGIYRSRKEDDRGYSGFRWELFNHSVATKDLKAGDALGPGDHG